MQRTLGIVSFNKKPNIVEKISIQDDLSIVFEKKFELSVESAKLALDKQTKEPQTVFGFILEGSNAIEDWLNIVDSEQSKSLLFHGSLNPENAQTEINWFQSESFPSTSSTSTASSSSSSSSAIPVKVANNRKNVIKKTTTSTKQSSVSGTTSPHQRKLALRDTTSSPDGPRNSLRKPAPIVRNSKIPNTRTPTTTTPLKTSRISNTTRVATPTTRTTATPPIRTATSKPAAKPTTKSTTKQLVPRRSELNGRRGSLVTATATATATTKLTTTTKGGVSKNTPPTSIITGRTRKYSKITEKKPVLNTTTATKPKSEKPVVVEKEEQVKEVNNENKSDEPVAVVEAEAAKEEEDEAIVVKEEKVEVVEEDEDEDEAIVVDAFDEEPQEIKVEQDEVIPTEDEEESHVLTQQPVSHPSTCSSADEHDAEVAAATSHQNTDAQHVKIAASIFQNSSRRSSSFSPNSVSSLPRPETPEVDQLRLRFENIIQTSSPNLTNELQAFPRRPSSKMSPEFISRIKEMKPKGPVGSKVKSMVELFMDENLNKWEF
ncbi:hypothetical protein MFLAVUS_003443 [Mucor flavus]|uniref:Uncharacterized protein n=1 Tax=Mucor flavus TaxID=439312 RepID=A0ABP9YT39_9FUNG